MGKCSIPRSNPGGGIERVGDIKVTTRTSLGNKWVLCNGDPIPGAEVVTPNITDNERWTNINGIPKKLSGFVVDTAKIRFIKNGYWIIPVYDSSSYCVYVWLYNSSTGTCREINVFSSTYNSEEGPPEDYGAFFDPATDTICIYAEFYKANFNIAFEVAIYSIPSDMIRGEFILSNTIEYSTQDATSVFDVLSLEAVSSTKAHAITYYNGQFFYSASVAYSTGEESDYGICYNFINILMNNRHLLWQKNTNSNIDNIEYSGDDYNVFYKPLYINSKLYLVENMYSFERISCIYDITINIYCVNQADDELDVSFTHVGYLYKFGEVDPFDVLVCANPSNMSVYALFLSSAGTNTQLFCGQISNTEASELEEIEEMSVSIYGYEIVSPRLFCLNNNVYFTGYYENGPSHFVVNIDTSSNMYWDMEFSTGINSLENIRIDSDEICKSNIIISEYINGSDNYYFFDGNDQVEKLPIISVDEEAYCFMKIKE